MSESDMWRCGHCGEITKFDPGMQLCRDLEGRVILACPDCVERYPDELTVVHNSEGIESISGGGIDCEKLGAYIDDYNRFIDRMGKLASRLNRQTEMLRTTSVSNTRST